MVLSRLVLNLGDSAARRDLSNPYEMHSTLMRMVDAGASRPLWRLEQPPGAQAPPTVLIQTESEPQGETLLATSPAYFLKFGSRQNLLLERIRQGDRINFRLRANPTVTREGKRHGLVRTEDQLAWLERQMEKAGATLLDAQTSQVGTLRVKRRGSDKRIVIMGVTFDGRLTVKDDERLRSVVRAGVGPAKSLGFGLLTLAR